MRELWLDPNLEPRFRCLQVGPSSDIPAEGVDGALVPFQCLVGVDLNYPTFQLRIPPHLFGFSNC